MVFVMNANKLWQRMVSICTRVSCVCVCLVCSVCVCLGVVEPRKQKGTQIGLVVDVDTILYQR